MSALTQDKARRSEQWKYKTFTLVSGKKAFKGARAMLNLGANTVEPASATPTTAAGQLPIGEFAEQVDAAGGALPVTVDFEAEITLERFANDGTNPCVQATDIGAIAYFSDDQTVSISPGAARSVAGRIWEVDATKGVAIQKLDTPQPMIAMVPTALTPNVYTANALAVTQVTHGAVYDVPTTGGVSTISLPTAAPDGTECEFMADGTKNGHTVQYLDAAGSVALTTALVASKRHHVRCTKRGGKWFANAYTSP